MLRHLLYALRCVEPAECFAKAKLIRGFKPRPQHEKRQTKRSDDFHGWGGGIRTPECWNQNPVPYHLATPQCVVVDSAVAVVSGIYFTICKV